MSADPGLRIGRRRDRGRRGRRPRGPRAPGRRRRGPRSAAAGARGAAGGRPPRGLRGITWTTSAPADVELCVGHRRRRARSRPAGGAVPDSDLGRQLAPMLALDMGTSAVLGCSDIVVRGDDVRYVKPVYGGWLARQVAYTPGHCRWPRCCRWPRRLARRTHRRPTTRRARPRRSGAGRGGSTPWRDAARAPGTRSADGRHRPRRAHRGRRRRRRQRRPAGRRPRSWPGCCRAPWAPRGPSSMTAGCRRSDSSDRRGRRWRPTSTLPSASQGRRTTSRASRTPGRSSPSTATTTPRSTRSRTRASPGTSPRSCLPFCGASGAGRTEGGRRAGDA